MSNPYYILIVGSTILQGSSFVASKVLLNHIPPLWLGGARFLVASLATLPVLWVLGRQRASSAPSVQMRSFPWPSLFLIGTLQTAMVMTLLFTGLQFSSPAKAAILMSTSPLFVAALGRPLLGEDLGRSGVAGLFLGVSGVALCVGPDALTVGGVNRGDLLLLGGAMAWAAATIATKRAQLAISGWTISFWQMLFGSMMLLLLAAMVEPPFPTTLPPPVLGWFLWLAVPASTGAFGLWFAALKIGGGTRTSGFLFLVPLFAAVFSYLVLGLPVTSGQIGGGLLIVAAVHLVNRRGKTR